MSWAFFVGHRSAEIDFRVVPERLGPALPVPRLPLTRLMLTGQSPLSALKLPINKLPHRPRQLFALAGIVAIRIVAP